MLVTHMPVLAFLVRDQLLQSLGGFLAVSFPQPRFCHKVTGALSRIWSLTGLHVVAFMEDGIVRFD